MKNKVLLAAAIFFVTLFCACLKKANETPDGHGGKDPMLPVNASLNSVTRLLPPEGAPALLDSDWTLSCVVRADDRSGNLYNQLVLEDSSAGIALLLNESSLYSRFPIGRKIYLKVKGLYLGNYHGMPQLGASPAPDNSGILQVTDIPAKNFAQHIVSANISVELPPLTVSMDDLMTPRSDLLNRLIVINDAEIADPNYDNLYADPAAATSIKLRNCNGAGIVLRSSNYAEFQSYPTPFGKGSITAVYTVYNGAGQLSIRDTADMRMGNVRCDGSVNSAAPLISLDSVRKIYNGKDTVLGNVHIHAIVTSDAVNKNFGTGNIIIQDKQKGIMVYFGSSATDMPDLGDSIDLNLAGAVLTKYNGALEIKNIKTSKASVLANGKFVVPVTVNLATLNADFANYESVLVKIVNAKITSTGNFSGNKTLSDASGTIVLYTSSSASFANTAVPNITKTFQAIATPYNTIKELKIRNPELDIY